MITTSQMYWITMLNSICITLFILIVLLGITILGLLICGCSLRSDFSTTEHGYVTGKRLHAVMLLLVPPFLFLMFVLALVPTTKQMAAILIIPRIANSEKVQQAGNKLYDLAVEWMAELKPNKNNKEGANK